MINALTDWLFIVRWIAVIVIFLLILMMMFGVFNNKWHIRIKSEAKQLEGERQSRRETTSNIISYENFISGLKDKFETPKDIIYDVKDLKDTKVSKKRLNDFIKWLKKKDSKLLSIIKDSKSLNVEIPDLNFNFTLVTREDGVIKNPEFDDNFFAYNIQEWLTYQVGEISVQNLVKLFSDAKIGESVLYEIFEDGTWSSYESEISSYYYTRNEDLKIPEDIVAPGYDDYFEGNISGGSFSGPVSDGEMILYCTADIDFQNKVFVFNNVEFKFNKSDKDYLLIMLMASYKPSLFKRLKDGLK